MEKFEIVALKSGVNSLRSLANRETYHPGIGPVEEARILHVEQQRLVQRCRWFQRLVIWDVGLGAGANATAAINALASTGADVELHSFDKTTAPLEFAVANTDSLPYLAPHRDHVLDLLQHGVAQPAPGIRWLFHKGDFQDTLMDRSLPSPHSIFWDPYSPATNADMWTLPLFQELRAKISTPCLLTNYSRSTATRTSLLLAGFFVGTGDAIDTKDETTIAAIHYGELRRPLEKRWLKRVLASGNAAPLRSENYSLSPIGPADYTALAAHPQFQY